MQLQRWHLSHLQQLVHVEQLDHVGLSRVLAGRDATHGIVGAEDVFAVASLSLAIAHDEPLDGFFS